jgi:UDP-N-acetylmuramoylalanine--D-glutamate ligase
MKYWLTYNLGNTAHMKDNFGVFGLARSGISTIKFLLNKNKQVIAWDDNPLAIEKVKNEYPELSHSLIPIKDPKWHEIRILVLSPGIPLYYPTPAHIVNLARKFNIKIMGDIELLYENNKDARYIGITGTNGKSTTTALTNFIFSNYYSDKVCMGGNIGKPVLDLPQLTKDGHYILEVSSYQLDLLDQTKFDTAILLNITKDHIDRHGNIENYIEAKKRIFKYQSKDSIAIIGIDNQITNKIYQELLINKHPAKIIPISTSKILSEGVSVVNNKLYFANQQFELACDQYLPGRHNAENIAASFAAAISSGIPANEIIKSINSFTGLKHRLEFVTSVNNIMFINDSKATNAEATENALNAFDNIYWIAGGVPKEGGIESLAKLFHKLKHTFLIGQATDEFALTLDKYGVPYTKCGDLKNAINIAYNMASTESAIYPVILLSPACASFDQWRDFEQRGNAFCSLANKIYCSKLT